MPDKQYGVVKVSGFTASNYESLTSHFEYVKIVTKVPIFTYNQWLTTAAGSGGGSGATDFANAAIAQANLDKLIQIVSLRGQPVIMGAVTWAATLYSVTSAIEHPNAWGSAATSGSTPSFATLNGGATPVPGGPGWPDVRLNEDLKNRLMLDGVNYGFGLDMTGSGGLNDTASLVVTISNTLPSL